jgi:acyl-CoA thioesterase FadM
VTGAPPLHRFTADYRVRFEECGPDGLIRGSSLLGIVQDVAWQHSEAVGLTRAWYAERSLLWLVRAVDVRILAPIAQGDALRLETRIEGYRRVLGRRVTRVARPDGTPVARILTDWVMTSLEGGLVRVADEIVARFPDAGTFEPIRVDRSDPPASATSLPLSVRLRDIDPVRHVNNGVYLDLLDESVDAAGADLFGTFPRRALLEYVDAAVRGDALVARAWPSDGGWGHRLERASDGSTLLRGRLEAGAGPD